MKNDSFTIADRIKNAVKLHQEGNLEAARRIYTQVLDVNPNSPDALHLMGVIAYQTGDHKSAIELITQAIGLEPRNPVFHKNLGNTHSACGQLDKAVDHYIHALNLRPDYGEVYYDLGIAYQLKKKFKEAIVCYQEALKIHPNDPDIQNNLGAVFYEQGDWEEAIGYYKRVLEQNPHSKEVYNNLGNALQAKGENAEAISCYRQALNQCGEHPKIYLNLGNVAQKIGRLDDAVDFYKQALSLNPDYAKALNNLGNVLKERSDFEKAQAYYHRAISIEKDNADYHFNLGLVHHLQNNLTDAYRCYRDAIRLKPDYPEAYNNIGKILHERHDFENAAASYQRAIQLNPAYTEAYFNRSLSLLIDGNLKDGWNDWEWRFQCREWQTVYPHRFKEKKWDGSNFAGKKLFVFSEQGIGDTLQFIRYLPSVKFLGGEVIFETLPPLINLLQDFPGVDKLVCMSMEEKNSEVFDLQIPLMSLAHVFGTTLEGIPAKVPYIRSNPQKVKYWSERLRGDLMKIGLVWAGKPTHKDDRRRSCPLQQLIPLLDLEGVRFYGLQKGDAAREIDDLSEDIGIENLGSEFNCFEDTAAVVDCMDLIISVDTAVAHLAGAMARPVWLMLPYTPDWRWLLYRNDTPWYPTMVLFRQQADGDWEGVIQKIKKKIKRILNDNLSSRH